MKKHYYGSCHCGAVLFEADIDLTETPIRKCNYLPPGGSSFAIPS